MTVTVEGSTGTSQPNLTFTGTGGRITGDFSNATVASRVIFQSSTTNGNTGIYAIPNGTSTSANFRATNSSDPNNGSYLGLTALSTDAQLASGINGTGTYLPMTFYTNGSERVRIATSGRFTTSKAANGVVVALTDGTTITPDFDTGNFFSVTLGGNRTLANPTNLTAGQSGVIVITQDATGSRTLAYGSNWKFSSGGAPTLTTTASAVDVLAYYVESASRITARLITDVK